MDKVNVLAFIDAEIERLQRAREILAGKDGLGGNAGSRGVAGGVRRRRHMSAAARRRISLAQKKRWAARKRAGL